MASKDKNSSKRAGKRKDRNKRFQVRTPILGYYLIVTDTEETEKNYFEGLKRSIPEEIRNRIVIRMEKAKTTYNLVERTRELCSAQAQQRIPWIVFDRVKQRTLTESFRRHWKIIFMLAGQTHALRFGCTHTLGRCRISRIQFPAAAFFWPIREGNRASIWKE